MVRRRHRHHHSTFDSRPNNSTTNSLQHHVTNTRRVKQHLNRNQNHNSRSSLNRTNTNHSQNHNRHRQNRTRTTRRLSPLTHSRQLHSTLNNVNGTPIILSRSLSPATHRPITIAVRVRTRPYLRLLPVNHREPNRKRSRPRPRNHILDPHKHHQRHHHDPHTRRRFASIRPTVPALTGPAYRDHAQRTTRTQQLPEPIDRATPTGPTAE